jgi:magnesium-transporting ATPase (P-type)
MTFANFITIQYALLIDKIPALNSLFGNLWIFATLFVATYVPIAIIIGFWHRKNQLRIEQEAIFYENVVGARMWLFMLELIEGNVTEEEKRDMRNLLRKIVKKGAVENKLKAENVEEKSKPS